MCTPPVRVHLKGEAGGGRREETKRVGLGNSSPSWFQCIFRATRVAELQLLPLKCCFYSSKPFTQTRMLPLPATESAKLTLPIFC